MTTTEPPRIDKWTLRNIVADIDLTDEEEAILNAKAAEFGITVEEYIRMMVGCQP